jgi:hypothetical protein
MNSWAGRATYFSSTSPGSGGDSSAGGLGASSHGGGGHASPSVQHEEQADSGKHSSLSSSQYGARSGVSSQGREAAGARTDVGVSNVSHGGDAAAASASPANSSPRKQSLFRKGSRGLLSEEIAEQKAHLEQHEHQGPGDSGAGPQRPPLSPAVGAAGSGLSSIDRSMSEQPLFDSLRGKHPQLDNAPMSAPLTPPAPIYGFGNHSHQPQTVGEDGRGHSVGGNRGVPGGTFGSSRMSGSPSLPFASSAGAASASYSLSALLASPAHVLSQRAESSAAASTDQSQHRQQQLRTFSAGSSRGGGAGVSGGEGSTPNSSMTPRGVDGESPPWNFKGLSSPGSTPRGEAVSQHFNSPP